MKIYRINLKLSNEELETISIERNLDFNILLENKKGYTDLWLSDSVGLIAFIRRGSKEMEYAEKFTKTLMGIVADAPSVIEPDSPVFDLDLILDKINKSGINSLSSGEKRFLESFKQ
jgi:hypothetical protein